MDKNEQVKAEPHDHNDHLPKDVLNLAQDENSFKDPLEQQLEKGATNPPPTKEQIAQNDKENQQ